MSVPWREQIVTAYSSISPPCGLGWWRTLSELPQPRKGAGTSRPSHHESRARRATEAETVFTIQWNRTMMIWGVAGWLIRFETVLRGMQSTLIVLTYQGVWNWGTYDVAWVIRATPLKMYPWSGWSWLCDSNLPIGPTALPSVGRNRPGPKFQHDSEEIQTQWPTDSHSEKLFTPPRQVVSGMISV